MRLFATTLGGPDMAGNGSPHRLPLDTCFLSSKPSSDAKTQKCENHRVSLMLRRADEQKARELQFSQTIEHLYEDR